MIENLKDYRYFQKLSGMVIPSSKNKEKIVSADFQTYYAKSESLNNRNKVTVLQFQCYEIYIAVKTVVSDINSDSRNERAIHSECFD